MDWCRNGVERRKTGSPEYIHSIVVKLPKLPNGEELQKKMKSQEISQCLRELCKMRKLQNIA